MKKIILVVFLVSFSFNICFSAENEEKNKTGKIDFLRVSVKTPDPNQQDVFQPSPMVIEKQKTTSIHIGKLVVFWKEK